MLPFPDTRNHASQIVSELDLNRVPTTDATPGAAGLAPVPSRLRPIGIDLFAGAGGFSLGASQAGVDIVAAVEKNRNACATYRTNLIESGKIPAHLFDKDILQLDPEEVLQKVGLAPGDCDILLGGPPCQGFSSHRLKDAGVDDPRNKLLIRYFDFVRVLRPTFFLVENVPGMLWERHRDYVEAFYRLAAENEYELPTPFVLNARDYGVPQNRKRVFLFGTDKLSGVTASWPPPPTHYPPDTIASETAVVDQAWNNAAVVFASPAPEGDPNDIHMNHGPTLLAAFAQTPLNGGSRFASGRTLECHRGHSGHYDVYGRINPNAPGPTMTTACINPSKGRFVHPTEPHGITLRQAARFQTFPEWFNFQGGLMSGGEQVGNAVPVNMAETLVSPLANACRVYRERMIG